MFPKNRSFSTQKIIHFYQVFYSTPSILGYPYFWKHPYIFGSVFSACPLYKMQITLVDTSNKNRGRLNRTECKMFQNIQEGPIRFSQFSPKWIPKNWSQNWFSGFPFEFLFTQNWSQKFQVLKSSHPPPKKKNEGLSEKPKTGWWLNQPL